MTHHVTNSKLPYKPPAMTHQVGSSKLPCKPPAMTHQVTNSKLPYKPPATTTPLLLVVLALLLHPAASRLVTAPTRETCVQMPLQPRHGKLTLSGQFVYRMTCGGEKGVDLPVNAPGDANTRNSGGVFFCRPNEINREFVNGFKFPQCLNKVPPVGISVPVRAKYQLSNTYTNCTEVANRLGTRFVKALGNAMVTVANKHCDQPKAASGEAKPGLILDILLKVRKHYNPETTLEGYYKMEKDVMERLKQAGAFNITGAEKTLLLRSFPAESRCDPSIPAVGTIPYVHGLANCRGCSKGYSLEWGIQQCKPCRLGTMTEEAYTASGPQACVQCPLEHMWGDMREHYLKECYDRTV